MADVLLPRDDGVIVRAVAQQTPKALGAHQVYRDLEAGSEDTLDARQTLG